MVLLVVIIALIVIAVFKESPNQKGQRAENNLIYNLQKTGIRKENIFNNLYVEKSNGKFSQIDAITLTDVGIIVLEVKNYSGWIFGNCKYSQWTQILAYGKSKYRFYNPVYQNNNHIIALRKKHRTLKNIPMFSVIVFDGDCKLKQISNIPPNTYIIKNYQVQNTFNRIITQNPTVSYDKNSLAPLLIKNMENGTDNDIVNQHIKNVQQYK